MSAGDLDRLARQVIEAYRARGLSVATAESCTGGLIAGRLTEVAGASAVVERGFVVYSNEAKQELLGVPAETLAAHGAVSEATVRAMAEGALRASPADVAVAVTGVAGPGGGSPEKPIGLVHLATAARGAETRHRRMSYGAIGRGGIRAATVGTALEMLLEQVGTAPRRWIAPPAISGLNVLLLFIGAILVLVACTLLGLGAIKLAGFNRPGTPALVAMTVLPSAAVVAWSMGWLRARAPAILASLRPGALTARRLLIGIGGGLLAAGGSYLVVLLSRPFLGRPKALEQLAGLAGDTGPLTLAIILLIAVLLAPLWEELLFRGALYGWCRGQLGVVWSALAVALCHSALHFDPAAMPALIAVFFWFGLLYERTGSLWVPVLGHATNNGLAVLLAWRYLAG